MHQPFEISVLTPADVSVMRDMNALFARAFDDRDRYLASPPDDAYLAAVLERAHVIAIAASIGGEVAGGLVAYQLDKLEQDRREIYIYDLAVDEPVRRRGIATAMIEALRAEARRRRAYVIFVQADLTDAPAIALYDKLGLRETAHHFDIAP